MQVHWLIEIGVFPETAPRVCSAIEARGDRWTRYTDGMAENGSDNEWERSTASLLKRLARSVT